MWGGGDVGGCGVGGGGCWEVWWEVEAGRWAGGEGGRQYFVASTARMAQAHAVYGVYCYLRGGPATGIQCCRLVHPKISL